jgi:hypothetical protein
MTQCYIWLPVLISIILVTIKIWNQVRQSWNWWPLCCAKVTIGWSYTSVYSYYVINRLHHLSRFETHAQLCMNIQDEIKCDKLSATCPVIENFWSVLPQQENTFMKGSIKAVLLHSLCSPNNSINGLSEISSSAPSTLLRNKFQSYW